MKLRKGDMFKRSPLPDVLIATGNATVKTDGKLVMGRGAARDMRDAHPGIDSAFGAILRTFDLRFGGPVARYGFIYVDVASPLYPILGLFQVKWNWFDDAGDMLLLFSAFRMLDEKARGDWAKKKIWMNFPGIGNAGLPRDAVFDVVRHFPDNVELWELP